MRQLWQTLTDTTSPLSGRRYLQLGCFLLLAKFCLDWTICRLVFDATFAPWMYFLRPVVPSFYEKGPRMGGLAYASTLATVGFAFVWPGILLTVRRLRTLKYPIPLIVLFFAPIVNIPFFLYLAFARPKDRDAAEISNEYIARSDSAAAAVLVASLIGLILVWFSTEILGRYGWGLFMGVPFICGFLSVMLYDSRESLTWAKCLALSNSAVLLIGILLLAFALEGIICLLMAAPIGFLLSSLGAMVAWGTISLSAESKSRSKSAGLSCVSLPMLMLLESAVLPATPDIHSVTTSHVIRATPETVWQHVISFSELPKPDEWIFATGLAYPVRARLEGTGVGAIRYCEFSTGPFVEPITVWDPPRKLAFDVRENPLPMKELSIFPEIHPRHLSGYFGSRAGQFELVDRGDGTVELIGTTWYQNSMWPRDYWNPISDYIVSTIHARVLRHIANLSEGKKR